MEKLYLRNRHLKLIMSQDKFLISTSTDFFYSQFSCLNKCLLLSSTHLSPRSWGHPWYLCLLHPTANPLSNPSNSTFKIYSEMCFLWHAPLPLWIKLPFSFFNMNANIKIAKIVIKSYCTLNIQIYKCYTFFFNSFLFHSFPFSSLSQTYKHNTNTQTIYM